MKLLLFSDLHCNEDAARAIVTQTQEHDVDVVIGAGDFATMRRGLERTIRVLSDIACPTLLVAGNSETPDELRQACKDWPSARVLHGDGCEIDGVPFFGLGGAVPVTPFGSWSFDLTEDTARQFLAVCPQRAVVITHAPPHGLADQDGSGQAMGSAASFELIGRTRPTLVVCGHIHASWRRIVEHNDTFVVNAGPGGMVWTI